MTNYIQDLLNKKRSNAIAMFFCGEYFVETIASHPRFSELQELYWNIETKLYNKLPKKIKAKQPLVLTQYTSEFFSSSNGSKDNQALFSLQQEILGEWAKTDIYFGVDILWHQVFKSAYESGNVTKTNADCDNLASLQDIPRY